MNEHGSKNNKGRKLTSVRMNLDLKRVVETNFVELVDMLVNCMY